MKRISGVYKITNTVTNDSYIGSSKDVKKRWREHKCQSTWKKYPNKQLYKDMQKYSVDKFELQILEEVEPEYLKETEQQFIEMMKPTYNQMNANGFNTERYKKYQKEYLKEYHKSDKYKEYQKEYQNKYHNQQCLYNGEILTLCALASRFKRAEIEHPTLEAKKYLVL